MRKLAALAVSHALALGIGFGAGIYVLPLLTAPEGPGAAELAAARTQAQFEGEFRKDLPGSDFLHWGEGRVSVGRNAVSLQGRVAPGPDYKLYLAPEFVATKDAFLKLKSRALRVGDVKTFENFVVPLPPSADITRYDTVVVWCESFSQFITAAKYR